MKLIGSRIEQQLREELLESSAGLRERVNVRLTEALESAGILPSNALILNWIPDQAEDFYVVLISIRELLHIEIPRDGGVVQMRRETLVEYERRVSKTLRLKIAVAKSLL